MSTPILTFFIEKDSHTFRVKFGFFGIRCYYTTIITVKNTGTPKKRWVFPPFTLTSFKLLPHNIPVAFVFEEYLQDGGYRVPVQHRHPKYPLEPHHIRILFLEREVHKKQVLPVGFLPSYPLRSHPSILRNEWTPHVV